MNELHFSVLGVGAWGPGFTNWSQLETLLNGDALSEDVPASPGPKPEIIPANERRRAPLPVRLAVESSWQASQAAGLAPAELRSVFVSGIGDTQLTDYMCRALASEHKALSPTKFHNSVHNAAAGYWTISTGCMQAANSVAGFEQSVGLSLLEALIQSEAEQQPILLTVYDAPCTPVLQELLINQQPFAASIVLLPNADGDSALASFQASLQDTPADWPTLSLNPELQQCYQENPSAKILPLLRMIAQFSTSEPARPKATTMPLSAGTSLVISAT